MVTFDSRQSVYEEASGWGKYVRGLLRSKMTCELNREGLVCFEGETGKYGKGWRCSDGRHKTAKG